MGKIVFSPYLLGGEADIYSFRIDDDKCSELQKFIVMFKESDNSYLLDDFNRIMGAMKSIASYGALENFFRNEGKFKDRVYAIPLLVKERNKRESLRLYCIRVSNKLIIFGGGGIKKTKTYQEDSKLLKHIKTLQKIDEKLSDLEKNDIVLEDDLINITLEI